jgi:hypothetical protein
MKAWTTALGLMALLAPACAAAQTEIDPTGFTQDVANRITGALGPGKVRVVGRLELTVEPPAPDPADPGDRPHEPATLYLDRIHQFCERNTAEACEETKSNYIAAMLAQRDGPPPLTRERLRVVVRGSDYCDQLETMFESGKRTPVIEALAPGLCAVLVADYPRLMGVITSDDLETLKLGVAGAWLIGREQALAGLPKVGREVELKDGVVALIDDPYMSSLVLDHDGWNQLARRTGGEILVAVPEDISVLVQRRSTADLPELRDLVTSIAHQAQRSISTRIYRWTGNGWAVLD